MTLGAIGTINVISAVADGFRPPNWGAQAVQTYSMTCTLPPDSPAAANQNQNPTVISSTPQPPQPMTFFFDAVLRVEHVQEAVGTRHPVQVGPAVVDHIYLNPARVVLDVAISDSMQSYLSGQYSGDASRSVNAYQTFKSIQAARVPISLATRLDSYENMWLADVRGTEDSTTSRSFRGTLHFEQIISAQVSSATVSSRPNASNTTNEGVKGVKPVPTELINQIPLSHF